MDVTPVKITRAERRAQKKKAKADTKALVRATAAMEKRVTKKLKARFGKGVTGVQLRPVGAHWAGSARIDGDEVSLNARVGPADEREFTQVVNQIDTRSAGEDGSGRVYSTAVLLRLHEQH